MRVLLAIHNAYTDHTSGAAHSMRIIMQWLGEAGHEVQVLSTARFDARSPGSFAQHLADREIDARRHPPAKAMLRSVRRPANLGPGRPTFEFTLNGVPVTALATAAPGNTPADRFEAEQFLFLLDQHLASFAPDVVLTYGGHPVVQEAMRRARASGAQVVFTLRNYGYENRRSFEHVDHVFTTSPYLSAFYRDRIGLQSLGIESPIDWQEVEAPEAMRRFVTFVNPSPAKGSLLFARLADMLGSARPDIPILVVQSATTAGRMNDLPGLDFTKYPHIMASPATPRPSDFFGLTRILLVPSTFAEPFGRVAAEALVNGIPPLVSDRGALPQTVGGGGTVIPLPAWLTPETTTLPGQEDARPWFERVCELWDDEVRYREASARALAEAHARYHETIMRRRYADYFASLRQGPALFL
ncbi:MAG: glycosyl transferase family 1 [Acidobacteria bacterium]|nr:glycosyl transferase family 1 [Acidobacteriota bacterium]